MATIEANGSVHFLHDDRLGTPQAATNSSQAVAWSTTYDPFGRIANAPTQLADDLRLPGQESDLETGLYHNGLRDYVPGWSAYSGSDPIGLGGGMNTFGYAAANPLRFTDPFGMDCPLAQMAGDYLNWASSSAESSLADTLVDGLSEFDSYGPQKNMFVATLPRFPSDNRDATRRGSQFSRLESEIFEREVETIRKDRVAIMENESVRMWLGKNLSELLRGPFRGRVVGHSAVQDPSRADLHRAEHVQNAERDRRPPVRNVLPARQHLHRAFHRRAGAHRALGFPRLRQGPPSSGPELRRLLRLRACQGDGRAAVVQRRGFQKDRYHLRLMTL